MKFIINKKDYYIWLIIFCSFLIEYLFFNHFFTHEIVNFYPRGFDQSSYLPEIYQIYLNLQSYNLIDALIRSPHLANGFLFTIEHAIFMLIMGANRSSALILNFLYFIMLQACLVYIVKKITNNWLYAFLCLGFVLLIKTPYNLVGGLSDVRIDFLAFVLYGIFVSLVIYSNIFENTKWARIATGVACILILTRFITAVYLSLIYFCCALFFVLCKKTETSRKCLKNILQTQCIIYALIFSYFWINKTALFCYYGIGHVLGAEKNFRALEQGVHTFTDNILFYPHNILIFQLGSTFVKHIVFFSILCTLLILYNWISYSKQRKKFIFSSLRDLSFRETVFFLTLTTCIPLVILTLDISKSLVVASIVIIPILWAFLLVFIIIFDSTKVIVKNKSVYYVLLFGLSFWVYIAGFQHQIHFLKSRLKTAELQELQKLTDAYLMIGDYAQTHHWPKVKISFVNIEDYLNRGNLQALYFEQRGILLKTEAKLGGSLFSVDSNEAMNLLQKSNVIILSTSLKHYLSPYPFNNSMNNLYPAIEKSTKKNFQLLTIFSFNHESYKVYVRSI